MVEMKKSLLIIFLVIVVIASMGCGSKSKTEPETKSTVSEKVTNEENESPVKELTPAFDQTALDQLASGWELKVNRVIEFPKSDVVVAGISNISEAEGKVIVVQYDHALDNWVSKWSGDILADGLYPFYEFQSITITKSTSLKKALAVIAADVGGSTGYGQALALTIDENGNVSLEEKYDIDTMSIELKDNIILVSGSQEFGSHQLSLQGDKFVDDKTSASQQAPDGAIQVPFKLDPEGNVVLLQGDTLNIKVGKTIAFIPADEKTKEAFDSGNIGIFTDGGDGYLATSNANRIGSGNSYTFNLNGTVQFLLLTPEKDLELIGTELEPTLTVTVEN
jgi:hypothetical protein